MKQMPISEPAPGTIRVAGWNIQHLGSRRPRRTKAELQALADRLLALCASVFVLQEIESLPVLESIADMMGLSWTIYFERRHSNALLYNSDEVHLIHAGILKAIDEVPYPGSISRKPVSAIFESGTKRFQVLGVHLHWSKRDTRREEAEWIARAAIRGLEHTLVFGDFNAEPDEEPHHILSESLIRLPKQNGFSTLLPFGLHFDHIYISSDAQNHIRDGHSVIVKPDLFGDSMRQTLMTYSDHLAVFADLIIGDHP